MIPEVSALLWGIDRIHEAIEALAKEAGMAQAGAAHFVAPVALPSMDEDAVKDYMDKASAAFGLEVEPVECSFAGLSSMLMGAVPALLSIKEGSDTRFLALVRGRRGRLSVLSPDRGVSTLYPDKVGEAIAADAVAGVSGEIDRLLDEAAISARSRKRAREVLIRERLVGARTGPCYLLRIPPEASFSKRAKHFGLYFRLFTFLCAYVVSHGLWIFSWFAVGRGALQGQIDPGWLTAWGLLLLTLVPLRMLVVWWSGRLAIDVGALIKERLLSGSLRIDPDKLKHQGVGQLMGRVLESEAVEALALSGGFLVLFSGFEIVTAGIILSMGSGGAFHVLLLFFWIALTAWMARRYFLERKRWTETRLAMTHNLIERMVGHKTRLAQQPPEAWHDDEDEELSAYLERSQAMDRIMAVFSALVPRGWLIVGVLGLSSAFLSGEAGMERFAVAFGGVLLAYRALRQMVEGLTYILGAAISWKEVAPLFHAAASEDTSRPYVSFFPVANPAAGNPSNGRAVLSARNLSYRYVNRGEPVLHDVRIEILQGERVLLQGPSGSGKSTLVSLLAGVRKPLSGLLLVSGIDHHLLDAAGWRKQVALAPQFHENHVFSGALAMNLLMGRRWPPSEEDLKEAEEMCRELGLGGLIDRMPAGIFQMVGETGWQLSHGERSRIFIARALLQRPEVAIFDESFGALDPETIEAVAYYVLKRASTLVVIAHV